MNLLEALKTGKNIRRKGWPEWCVHGSVQLLCPSANPSNLYYLENLTAEDWEVQEPSVPVTRTQFLQAAVDALGDVNVRTMFGALSIDDVVTSSVLVNMAKKLGLEE